MKRVGILVKPGREEAAETADLCEQWLRDNDLQAVRVEVEREQLNPRASQEFPTLPADLSLLITIGGDGTLLLGARAIAQRAIPILGVNVGRLGFLTDAAPSEVIATLETWRSGEATLEPRMCLDVALRRGDAVLTTRRVLNDVVVSFGSIARMIEVDSLVDGHLAHSTRADGFIVATPTGSTAYNLAAGGPLVHPSDAGIALTPICPHTLSDKPIVVGSKREVALRLRPGDYHAVLTLDGQLAYELQPGDHIVCTRARQDTLLVRTRSLDFFEVLRHKLGWGENGVRR